jgi:precorrin-6A/cobalt-precorrin-6A reductase
MRLLLLGGTTEASRLARRLAGRENIAATLSLAGRTMSPAAAPLPTRIGGFGGVEGLSRYLREGRIDAVVDATHPFAAQMSSHAVSACAGVGVRLAVFTRPPWRAGTGDKWIEVADAAEAAAALGGPPRRVFLTVGRLLLAAFRDLPHHFLLRTIDPPASEALPQSVEILSAKGPFTVADEIELMRKHGIEIVVSKNSGGEATGAKIEAARRLGLEVVMIRRPPGLGQTMFFDLDEIVGWIEGQVAGP